MGLWKIENPAQEKDKGNPLVQGDPRITTASQAS